MNPARPPYPRFRRRTLAWAAAGVLAGPCNGISAQTAEALPAEREAPFVLTPGIELRQTLTDNVRLVATGEEAEAVTELSATLKLERLRGPVQGFLDYRLTGRLHARGRAEDDFRNALDAQARAELVDEFAYLDASAAISQQAISAFGPQSVDDTVAHPNRAEVRSYRLSPHLRGRLGSRGSYEARLSQAVTRSSEAQASDVDHLQASLRLQGDTSGTFGWALQGSRSVTDYRLGRQTETDSLTGTLRTEMGPRLRLSVTGGAEASDVLDPDKPTRSRYGLGLDWRPTERTTLSAEREQRYFGKAHSFVFTHRMPRSVWSYSDVRDVRSESEAGLGGRGTNFDLFFQQFSQVEPDPVRRTALVRNYLQTHGLSADAPVLGGFLATALTLERRQSLSVAFSGQRTVLILTAAQSQRRRLDTLAPGLDDLSVAERVRQRGGNVMVARQLSPTASLNLGFDQQQTRGDLVSQSNRLRSWALTWSDRIGPRASVSVGARVARFDSPSNPYRENAVMGQLRLEF